MDIKPHEVAYKRRIGQLDNCPVYEIGMIGGLHLIVAAKGGKTGELLGMAPRPGVALFIAKNKNPNLEITVLDKSEHLLISAAARPFVEEWTNITDQVLARL